MIATDVNPSIRPGAIFGEIDVGYKNFVAQLDDLVRGEVAGYNTAVRGKFRQLFPRISKRDFADLKVSELAEVQGGMERLLDYMPSVSAACRRHILSTRKLVRQALTDDKYRYVMVPNLPKAMTEAQVAKAEAELCESGFDGASVEQPAPGPRRKARTYALSQLLSDTDVIDKYNLSVRTTETAKRLAATDPMAAANMYQEYMNISQSDIQVTVKAGALSNDKGQAKNTIQQICKAAPRTETSVHTVVVMDTIYMFGPGGESDWHVRGPLKHAVEVSYVYWFVALEGCIMPSFLLDAELQKLGIDVHDGFSFAVPEIKLHAARDGEVTLLSGIPSATSSLLTAADRVKLRDVGGRLLPVMGSDGTQLATSVRVTGKYVLINSHVVDMDSTCTVAGERVVVRSQLSRDLWSVKNNGESTPWTMREPVVGETVVVCFLTNGEFGCSAPLRITSVDRSCIVTTSDQSVSYGASGGALVALDDMALLGVHSAATMYNLISYRFGEAQFADLMDSDSATSFSRRSDAGSFAETIVAFFKKRGMASIMQAAIDSLEAVYSGGMHVGMAVRSGSHMYTTCNAEMPLELGDDRRRQLYTSVSETRNASGTGLFRTEATPGGAPVFMRKPTTYFEKVFILGYDTEPYISNQTTVALIGPDHRYFVINALPAVDKPVQGGLIMGMDGAVLGCCGPESTSTAVGLGYLCYPIPKDVKVDVRDPRATLAASFPFLNVAAWSDSLIEEVFTHSSAAQYKDAERKFNAGLKPLANIGDNVAKAELYKVLREFQLPHSQWAAAMQSSQSNLKFSEVAWKMGFASALIVGSGVSMQRTSKAYADLTEAVIGAAWLTEKPEVVTMLCRTMDILFVPTSKTEIVERYSEAGE